jgi:hypothetical protein
MGWFQLDPTSIAARARGANPPARVPGLAGSLWRGILGFTVVSMAGFAPWAVTGKWFYQNIGEAGLYAVCAIVFIGLSGLLLHQLIIGPGSLGRFYKLFSLAFAAYSVAWIAGWMSLRGHPGSFAGLLAGAAVMGWMLATAFDARSAALKIIAALFVFNATGYFIGGFFEGWLLDMKECNVVGVPLTQSTQALVAKMQWGVCYGLGLGAGLGLAFYFCQAQARALLGAKASDR